MFNPIVNWFDSSISKILNPTIHNVSFLIMSNAKLHNPVKGFSWEPSSCPIKVKKEKCSFKNVSKISFQWSSLYGWEHAMRCGSLQLAYLLNWVIYINLLAKGIENKGRKKTWKWNRDKSIFNFNCLLTGPKLNFRAYFSMKLNQSQHSTEPT